MNTLTNAYVTKFSSGTILALLAISGFLFLVPVTTPVFASNATPPTIAVTTNNPALGGTPQTFSATITNPAGNSYTVTGVSINMAVGWSASAAGAGGYLTVAQVSGAGSGVKFSVSSFTVGTAAGIPPGQSDTVSFTATSATGTYPIHSSFATTIQDASAVNFYNGPSFSVLVIDPTTTVAVTVTPGGTNTATSYTAGTAPYTVSAVVTPHQAGLTVTWSDTGTGKTAAYPSSFSAPSSITDSTGTATVTYQPSDTAGATGLTATFNVRTNGSCTAAGCKAASAITSTTVAGAPSAVTVTAGGSSTATDYITTSGTGTYTGAVLSAEIVSGGITGALVDAYGNPVTSGITFAAGQGCSVLSFGGTFDNAATATTTDSIAGGAAGCTTAGAIASSENYFQGLAFGTTTYVQVSMTGTYATKTFSAVGNSQTLSTSSMDTSAATPAVTCAACTGLNVKAGNAAGTVSTITLTYTLTVHQDGVPITFLAVNTTNPYAGSFVGGMGPSTHIDYANVTVNSVENSGGTAAIATATFTIDPTVGAAVEFEAEFANPITGTPSHIIGPSLPTGVYTTVAGDAAKLTVTTYFTANGPANPTTKTVAGQNVYLNVVLVDYWGNAVTCTAAACGGQLQIALSAPSSVGTFSAMSVYIAQSQSDTYHSFGTITFAVKSSAPLGAITISASGFYSGSGTLTIVSPNPTITVNTPANTIGHTVYSRFSGVGFSGSAAASLGYLAGTVTISSVTYSIDGATALSASGTTAWTAVPTMANGLHTITFTAKDSNGNTASNTTSVLVDTTAPTITNPTTTSYGAGTPIKFSIADSEGDLDASSVTATVNGTALPAADVSVSGTNNPGSPVTYTVSVTGLAASIGHYGIVISAKDLAGNSATGTNFVVQVTVQQAQSLVLQGTPTSGKIGNYEGVTVSYQNEWYSAQNVVVFGVWKNSLGQTVYISAGSANLASGQTQSFFLPEVGLASGTYTVNVFVWTTSNTSVSITTPVPVTF